MNHKDFVTDLIQTIEKDGRITIYGLGTFYLVPRRKGKVYGIGDTGKILYAKRLKFKPSVKLKNRLCKQTCIKNDIVV